MRLLLLSCCLVVFFAGCTKEEATPVPVVKKIRARFKNGLDGDIYDFRFQSTPNLPVLKIDFIKKGGYSDYIEDPEIYQNQTATAPMSYYFSLYISTINYVSGNLLGINTQKLFPGDHTIAIMSYGTGATRTFRFEFEK